MRIVVAPNAFKGALGAPAAARAIAAGLRGCAHPPEEIDLCPMADGGEGTADCLLAASGGLRRRRRVSGPFGNPRRAAYAELADGLTAVVETAAASGLGRVRDPLRATTFGTGQLVAAALASGRRRILVGLGGSATNDGGRGFAEALGFRFLDASGQELPPGPLALQQLARIDRSAVEPRLTEAEVVGLTDVDNPLCGPNGASATFGPQKGATPEMIGQLDRALARLAEVAGRDLATAPGAGAAGGLGFGLMVFAGGGLRPGAQACLDAVGLERRMRRCTIAFTGEGRIDAQTLHGKAPLAVARAARAAGVPLVALVGQVSGDLVPLYDEGFTAIVPIAAGPMTVRAAIRGTAASLRDAAARVWRLFLAGRESSA